MNGGAEPEPGLGPEPGSKSGEPAAAQAGLIGAPTPAPDRSFRDYYRIEDEEGRRFWVFRQGAVVKDAPPGWFLHGLFA